MKEKTIQSGTAKSLAVSVPGSKSYTHRLLVASALARGRSLVLNALKSQDTLLTARGLRAMGAGIEDLSDGFSVEGAGPRPAPAAGPVDLGNSGTSMRILTAVAALGQGEYLLTGSGRMKQRPIGDLVDALLLLGVPVVAESPGGCPPVRITGTRIAKNRTRVDCHLSSQFLSGLLLMAPCTENGLEIEVSQGPVSRPYLDMTVAAMETLGARVDRRGYEWFSVPPAAYRPGEYEVEADASAASYFWAAAAVTGASVTVRGLHPDSVQGDVGLARLFERMGCRVEDTPQGIRVTGGPLVGIEADMGDMPDVAPTLAMVAAFAQGETLIKNVGHLREKESDRLSAMAGELSKMGIRAEVRGDDLLVEGGKPRPAAIDTFDDHRVAMCFAVAGLAAPGTVIRDPDCVAKSFPGFWDELGKFYR
ncbi:MAG: 3-phosphoshikimate 1-carboxyvinyltransferase [Pseudomonadota bacterium]